MVLLHGGPGMDAAYMDPAAEELAASYRAVPYQQRGLAPSTVEGPFTIAQALADIEAVLDHFGWERVYVVGHSWGGHLAFHAAVSLPHRLLGVLSVDPLGAVGDGAAQAFGEAMMARLPDEVRDRVRDIDEREMRGEATEAETVENWELLWPSYFADPANAPPPPKMVMSMAAHAGLWADLNAALPGLEAALPSITVPLGVVVGAQSPMPPDQAGLASAERVPGAWGWSVPGAGHFVWHESPGCLLAAMDRLTAGID